MEKDRGDLKAHTVPYTFLYKSRHDKTHHQIEGQIERHLQIMLPNKMNRARLTKYSCVGLSISLFLKFVFQKFVWLIYLVFF